MRGQVRHSDRRAGSRRLVQTHLPKHPPQPTSCCPPPLVSCVCLITCLLLRRRRSDRTRGPRSPRRTSPTPRPRRQGRRRRPTPPARGGGRRCQTRCSQATLASSPVPLPIYSRARRSMRPSCATPAIETPQRHARATPALYPCRARTAPPQECASSGQQKAEGKHGASPRRMLPVYHPSRSSSRRCRAA